jgi:hypothetical protein
VALRQFLSFDYFPSNGVANGTSFYTPFYPGAVGNDPGGQGLFAGPTAGPVGAAIATGWLRGVFYGYSLAGNGAGGCSCFGLPMSTISDVTTRATYIGFRYARSTQAVGQVTPPGAVLTNSGGTIQTILPYNATAANQIAYIEVLIDRLNKVLTVWVDGTQFSSAFFDYTAYANGADTTLWFGAPFNFGYTGGNSTTWYVRDFYSLDDTQDSTLCSRLGPVDVRPAALGSVTAPNWISSDSQPALADLSTPFGAAATWPIPTQTEPTSMDPLQFTLSNGGLVSNERILAVKADISAQRPGGFMFSPQITVKYNNQTAQARQMVYPTPNALVFNQNAFLLEKAPDGTAWTPQALAGAVATLTP